MPSDTSCEHNSSTGVSKVTINHNIYTNRRPHLAVVVGEAAMVEGDERGKIAGDNVTPTHGIGQVQVAQVPVLAMSVSIVIISSGSNSSSGSSCRSSSSSRSCSMNMQMVLESRCFIMISNSCKYYDNADK